MHILCISLRHYKSFAVMHGSMLWDLASPSSDQFFKCCVKLFYDFLRITLTYLVEGWFAADLVSLRNHFFARYFGFYRSLLSSPSREIRALVMLVFNDPRSYMQEYLIFVTNWFVSASLIVKLQS